MVDKEEAEEARMAGGGDAASGDASGDKADKQHNDDNDHDAKPGPAAG